MKARDHKKILREITKTHEQKMAELRKRIADAMQEPKEEMATEKGE